MSLTEFSNQVVNAFSQSKDIEKRMEHACNLAKRYNIERPEMVLIVTHPDLSLLPIKDRCEKLNITEEEYMFYIVQDGFQNFVADWQKVLTTNMRLQAISSTSQALKVERFSYNKNGDASPNHQLEVEVIKSISAEKSGTNVSVNLQNNIWADAMKLAGKN